jgi:hypothetical protein
MRTITVQERRRRLVRQHYLDGGATSPEALVDALVALHATDPASVYLAVLAERSVNLGRRVRGHVRAAESGAMDGDAPYALPLRPSGHPDRAGRRQHTSRRDAASATRRATGAQRERTAN